MSLSQRLLWLNGLAIMSVAGHHAAAFALQAMFDWSYTAVGQTPNFERLGSPPYYIIMVLRLLLSFAGPAFFFISGYFIGIIAKGTQTKLGMRMVLSRIKFLFIPFVIWTVIRYLLLRNIPTSIDEILTPYHWIPLLIQFYALSPFIAALAKRNWKLLVGIAFLLGLFVPTLTYLALFGDSSAQELLSNLPNWVIFWTLPFWFPFGVVVGLNFMSVKPYLIRYRWQLLVAALVTSLLVLVEYELVDWLSGPRWLGPGFSGFAYFPYSLFFILSYLAFEKSRMPLAKEVAQIGTKSLGIYLGNIPSVYVAAVLMYRLTPVLLDYQLVYLAILILVGLAVPLLLMEAVRRSPFRHRYRILFG